MNDICIIVRGLTLGGVRRFLESMLIEIDNLNFSQYKFHLVHNEIDFQNKFKNIKCYYIGTKNKFIFDYFFSFYFLSRKRFDILIYPKNVIPLNHFLLKGKKFNVIHDLGYFESTIKAYPILDTLFMRIFMGLSCKKSKSVFAVSNYTKQDIIDRLNIDGDKITVIHEGVASNFQVVKNEKRLENTREKYSLEDKFLFYSGSINPRKNLLRVLKAFKEIKNRIPHSLVITGIKKWKGKEFEEYINSNLQGRVMKLGYVDEDDLVDLYNLADLCIYPSLYEGFGLPILEAQKCGCPVLTSNATSCLEVAGDGAEIVDPYSINNIADGILKIAHNENYREELIQKGFKNVQRYSFEKTVNLILAKVEQ